jgi:hypothetical protein
VPQPAPPRWLLSGIGVQTNGAVTLQISGPSGKTYIVQASTSLVTWLDLATNVASLA